MKRRFRRRFTISSAAGFLFVAYLLFRVWYVARTPVTHDALDAGSHRIARVVDGDTLLLMNGARVRLQGVDTPETVKPAHPVEAWGPEATAFTRRFVSGGYVRLEFDRERLDRHGRFLAYVWVDRRMLNEELVRAGLARAEPRYRYSDAMKRRFLRAEAEAKVAGRGIWSGSDGDL
ncbi:MAG: thermonuclease family protein [Pirellulales bacterium]